MPDTLVLNTDTLMNFKLDSVHESDRSFILFKQKKIDFGKVKKKDVSRILVNFPFVNIGHTGLVIFKADVSCNCLTTTYPTAPLPSGEIAIMKVLINLEHQQGAFNKRIFIKSNAFNDVDVIHVRGFVE